MTTNKQLYGTPYFNTATGSTSALASKSAVAGVRYYVTDISVSSDKPGAIVQVKDGATIIWQNIVNGATGTTIAPYSEHFETPLPCTSGATASVTVDGGAACAANIAGFSNNS